MGRRIGCRSSVGEIVVGGVKDGIYVGVGCGTVVLALHVLSLEGASELFEDPDCY